MKKIATLVLLGFLMLFADGPVLKTGQTAVYQTGDDGTYKAGIARSYTAGSGVVTDNVTGLVWQDDAIGSTMDWASAGTYCENLSLGGQTDWRLPSIDELKTLVDYGKEHPATNTAFTNTSSTGYWSSTTLAAYPGYAWFVDFWFGQDGWVDKANSFPVVRCVRGTSTSASAYVRDNATQTVYDSQTDLTWQDDATVSASGQAKIWSDAISYCENLIFAGVDDWRLPNLNELFSIADHNRASPAIDPAFTHVATDDYWSSTVTATTATNVWGVFSSYGNGNRYHTSMPNYVRCVRSGQIPAPVYIDPNQISASVQITDGWNLIAVPFNTNDEFDISSLVQGMATIGWKFKYITNNGDTYSWDKWEKGTTLKLKNGEGLFIGIPSTLLPRPSDYIQFQGLKTDTLLKFEDKTYLQNKWYLLGFGYEVKMSDVLTHYSNATVWIMENGAYKKLTNTDTIKIGQGFWFKYN